MSSTSDAAAARPVRSAAETQAIVARSLKRRYRAEMRFRAYGILAVLAGVAFVVFLFGSIFSQGASVFRQAYLQLPIHYDQEVVDPQGRRDPDELVTADYQALIRASLKERFPTVEGRQNLRQLYALASSAASMELRRRVLADPSLIGHGETVWVLADDGVDMLLKGHMRRDAPPEERRLSDQQVGWIAELERDGLLELRFNRSFFGNGDSRDPEQAGVRGALFGSFLTLLITLLLSFPIGVAAAVYLEEFAPRNRMTDLIEVNINNLAAVPSIVFGLLGLAVFIAFFGMPRSAPVVGGLVLTLLTLPTIIIASRAALKAVPPSIREAALGMGASRIQTVAHHVLPLAMPGMLTGAIIGMARALGESAPLLMIGMVAFIVDVPKSVLDPATVLPVQVFLWSDLPERSFVERTSGAIIVLLAFLLVMNATAVVLRNRFEKRW
ncbi:MAG: phosphate ABC transporter permease PstA [Sinobacteraceae bacterium]|nr:phosphate ABC transporter permease PstA [Nevskiaceae bacterium]MCP5360592.1 phosphate ABC transporter permease PstA [Nevskiaceae bacterium]MCP5467206.1 phosphate ABC transporter permease PstA [Nevskiaceae bacterium]